MTLICYIKLEFSPIFAGFCRFGSQQRSGNVYL